MSSLLPQADGYLPYWMLFVSSLGVFNTLQNYATNKLTRRIYSNAPAAVTSLQSRTFGTWTLLSSIIRIYAAYHIHDKGVYDMAIATYGIVIAHYLLEAFVYRTISFGSGILSIAIVGPSSLVWMLSQYSYYVGNTF